MTEPCRAPRGLPEAAVREYRRILGRAVRASACTALPYPAVSSDR